MKDSNTGARDIEGLPLSDPIFDPLFKTPQVVDDETTALAGGTPFAPLPIGPYDETLPADANQAFGQCSQFCTFEASGLGSSRGASVEEHGPWCESYMMGHVEGQDSTGRRLTASAYIVDRYMHGQYREGFKQIRRHNGRYIRLDLFDHDDEIAALHLTLGDALRLSAALQHIVHEADGLNKSLVAA